MPLRCGSQSRLGEWKSRSTQVGGDSIAGLQQLAPQRPKRPRSVSRHRCVEPRQEPVQQELGFDQEGVHVVEGMRYSTWGATGSVSGSRCSCKASSTSTAAS